MTYNAVFTLTLSLLAAGLTACTPTPDDANLSVAALSTTAQLSLPCSSCHIGTHAGMPSIDGWSSEQLKTALTRYKSEDGDSVMHRYTRALSTADIDAVADYLGAPS